MGTRFFGSRLATCVVIAAALVSVGARSKPATRPATRPVAVRPVGDVVTAPNPDGEMPVEGRPATQPKDDSKELEEFIRGANLETDSEVQSLLRRAWEHIDAQRYREAVTVLQHVIDRPVDTLASTDGRVFRPARAIAAEILASLPHEGRDLYRLWADGEARGIVGDPNKSVDGEALSEVVRRYALSSLGDASAYRLACLALDRHDYGTARRLLAAALAHPEPTLDRGAVLVRLAFACARMRDAAGASAARAKLAAVEGRIPPALLAMIDQEIKGMSAPAVPEAAADWKMPFGSPARQGQIAGLPVSLLQTNEKLWMTFWMSDWKLALPPTVPTRMISSAGIQTLDHSLAGRRATLVSMWEEKATPPTCQPVLSGDRVVFKTHNTLVCVSLRTGKHLWEAKEEPANDTSGRVYYVGGYDGNIAADIHSALTDHLSRTLSIVDETVYQIQCNRVGVPRTMGVVMIGGKRAEQPKVAEGSILSAHDLKTGKLLWKLGRDLDEAKPFNAVRWLAAPTPCAGRLLVPVEEKGELALVALNASDGSPAWKRFLCTYAAARMVYARPVGVWAQGGEVYVASGKGVLFALDGIDGSLIWASRYEPAAPQRTQTYGVYVPEGWQEDYVAAIGDVVVVAPSDAKCVLGFDRRNGKFIFQHDVEEPRYCLGSADGAVFFMTGGGVSRLDVTSRKWAWKKKVAKNCGRGVIAGDALQVPSDRQVLRMDLKTGKILDRLRVKLPNDDPVGNLLVAGKNLLVAGVDQVTALASAAAMFASLDARISATPDSAGFLERGRLHRDAGREAKYVEDLRQAQQLMAANDPQKNKVAGELLTALLALSRQEPASSESLLKEAAGLAQTPAHRASVAMARAQWLGASGKIIESARAWREVASAGADDLVHDLDDPRLKISLSTAGTAALRSLTDKGNAVDPALPAMAQEELKKAAASGSAASAVAVLRSYLGTPAGVRAIVPVSQRLISTAGREAAELLLSDLSKDSNGEVAATALAALAEMREGAGWKKQAARDWDRLRQLHGSVKIDRGGAQITGAELAGQHLAANALDLTWPKAARLPNPPYRCAWTVQGDSLLLLRSSAEDLTEFLGDHVVFLNGRERSVQCHSLATGELKWKAEFSAAAAGGSATDAARAAAMSSIYSVGMQQGLYHDEHIAVVRSGRSIHAISLLNGKRLWTLKDVFGGETVNANLQYIYTSRGDMQLMGGDLSVDAGTLVLRPTTEEVRVVDLATGRVRWERQLKKNATHQVLLRNGYVLITSTVQATNQAMAIGIAGIGGQMQPPVTMICDRYTGKVLGEMTWEGRTNYGTAAHWTSWGVIYIAYNPFNQGEKKMIAKELPSGNTRWSVEWKGLNVPQTLLAAGDKERPIVVAYGHMTLAGFDVATGRELWRQDHDRTNYNYGQAPGISHDGKSVYQMTFGQPDGKGNQGKQTWRVISVFDGKVTRELVLGEQTRVFGGMVMTPMSAAGDWVVMGRVGQTTNAQGRVTYSGQQTMTAYPLTGAKDAQPVDLPPPLGRQKFENPRSPTVVGNYLLVGFRDGMAAYSGEKARE